MGTKKNESEKPKPRKTVYLINHTASQITKLLTHYNLEQREEIVEHLCKTFEDIAEYFKTRDNAVYERYRTREWELTKKYRKAYKPVSDYQFHLLFDFDLLLVTTGYYTTDEFNALGVDQAGQLTEAEVKEWTRVIRSFLLEDLRRVYLREDEIEPNTIKEISQPDKEMTEARQLLAIYYLLKAGFGIEQHKSHNVAEIVRFAHLLLGVKYTNPQNSNIYKKYKKLPNYNNGEYLIKDLRYIRPYFVALNIHVAIELIDTQIVNTINELPAAERKKYRE